jgi:hypothetical protein
VKLALDFIEPKSSEFQLLNNVRLFLEHLTDLSIVVGAAVQTGAVDQAMVSPAKIFWILVFSVEILMCCSI